MTAQPQAKGAPPAQAEPPPFVERAANGNALRFDAEARELWDYVPVPPVVLDADGYLVSDSMSQNDRHLGRLLAYAPTLKRFYRGRGGMVGADLSMHYVKGNRRRTLSPDLFVARKAEEREGRSSYKLWDEPVPEFVLEDLSPGNWRKDAVDKRVLYRRLGVQEYWMFDETGRRLRDDSGARLGARLVGYRLRAGDYERIRANDAGRLPSEALGLELCVKDDLLRFFDPATARYLPTLDEAEDEAGKERAGRKSAERREAAERAGRESAERREAAERAGRESAERRGAAAEQREAAALARVEALEALLRAKGA